VNAVEAESRRAALFTPLGHAHGPVRVREVVRFENPDYPLTLDLRRLKSGIAATAFPC
jgi:uncharacterized protein (DUF2126 family)